jgi:RNA polymerase sigma factor (sigma-70 family)
LAIVRQIDFQPKDENQLWQLMMQGDNTALAGLMDVYMDVLYNYGIRFTEDRALVEDCIQNLFIGIWQRRDFLSTPVNLKSYLFSSLRRMIHRNTRHIKKIPIVSFSDNDSPGFNFEFSIEHALIQQEESRIIAHKINHLITALPKRQKEIIYLKFFENLSREEIADIMQISPQAVSNLLQKALKNLRSTNGTIALTIITLTTLGLAAAQHISSLRK